MSATQSPSAPQAEERQPQEYPNLEKTITAIITIVPFLALIYGVTLAWGTTLSWPVVIVGGIFYLLSGFGITIGFHRLFTHRSFETSPTMRVILAVLGSMAIEGPILNWVADHRKHHAYADKPGDPHSPHLDEAKGIGGVIRGLYHAHLGWLFVDAGRALQTRYCPDLLKEKEIVWVNKTFLFWASLGLILPAMIGLVLTGTLEGMWSFFLWGSLVRIMLLHHVTYSINSICHFFGYKSFKSEDESGNVPILAIFSMGESWHHNHHAFPTSARHGLKWWEVDPSGLIIQGMSKVGLAWSVKLPSKEQLAARAL